MNDENKVVASLIYFKPGVDKERVERWVQALIDKGFAEGATTHEYNPEFGDPTWYIP
jgi:hypothetical protein